MLRTLKAALTVMGWSFKADPKRATAALLLALPDQWGGAIVAIGLATITSGALSGDTARIVLGAALVASIVGGLQFTGILGFRIRRTLTEQAMLLLDQRLVELSVTPPGLEHHERADYADRVQLLIAEREMLGSGFDYLVWTIARFTSTFGALALLIRIHPAMALLPVFAIGSFAASILTGPIVTKAQNRMAEPARVSLHLRHLLTTAPPAKELRVFGLGGKLSDRFRDELDALNRERVRLAWHQGLYTFAGSLLFAVGYLGAVGLAVREAVSGAIGLPEVVLAVALAAQVQGLVLSAANYVNVMVIVLRIARRFLWLEDVVSVATRAMTPEQPCRVPDGLSDGIRFHGVTFRYPGTDVDVLSDVGLHLPAGSVVAIVGENGAGKTSLVKLLARFYDPTQGMITVDGVDLRNFEPDDWRSAISGAFQDFSKFEFVARESVGVGQLSAMADDEAVLAALDRAAARDVVLHLPSGLDTQLGRLFEGGVELSGGQWQKLALGRAMMRPRPLLLLLDEPTSALDAETEHALFEKYASAARRAANETGAITVLVSHRFSTVRMADLIVVFDAGRVTEVGSHAELMSNDGTYAELYELQARAYR